MSVYGGDGNDTFETDRVEDVMLGSSLTSVLKGDAGDDKITSLQFASSATVSGGTGDDKIIYYDNPTATIAGNDGDDIIYG